MTIKLIAFLALLCPLALAQAATVSLRQILEDQTAAWNRGDLEGFMQAYWHSSEMTFFSGNTISMGWEAALQRYREKYQAAGKEMGKLSFTDEKIETLAPDAALVTARWHLQVSDGKKLEGLTTVICRHFKEGWRIVHDHSS